MSTCSIRVLRRRGVRRGRRIRLGRTWWGARCAGARYSSGRRRCWRAGRGRARSSRDRRCSRAPPGRTDHPSRIAPRAGGPAATICSRPGDWAPGGGDAGELLRSRAGRWRPGPDVPGGLIQTGWVAAWRRARRRRHRGWHGRPGGTFWWGAREGVRSLTWHLPAGRRRARRCSSTEASAGHRDGDDDVLAVHAHGLLLPASVVAARVEEGQRGR